MTKKLLVAVAFAVFLDMLAAGYGTVAAGRQASATCSQDGGTVQSHECVRDGQVLFNVPL